MTFKPLGDPKAHYWKVLRMAAARDVSLRDAAAAGDLPQEAFSAMIERCRTCEKPGACARLLDRFTALEATPGYCRNTDEFARLAGE